MSNRKLSQNGKDKSLGVTVCFGENNRFCVIRASVHVNEGKKCPY